MVYLLNLSRKIVLFVKNPHLPWRLDEMLKNSFPRFHRLLKYGTLDSTSKKYWDGIWSEEGLSTWRTYPNLFGKISKEVRPNSKILDIGCGAGVLLSELRTQQKGICFGLDISSEAIKLLKAMKMPGVVARLPEIPLKDSSFDVVIATEVLEHIENPSETLKQMKRVAKSGGFIICSVPNECMTKEECDEHLHNFDLESFRNLISDLGEFEIFNIEDQGGPRLLGIIRNTSNI